MKKFDKIELTDYHGNISFFEKGVIGRGRQVSWMYNDRKIVKTVKHPEEQVLIACLSIDKEYLVMVFGSLEGIDDQFESAVFNPDGSVHLIIEPPLLISERYNEYQNKVGEEEARKSVSILQPAIRTLPDGAEEFRMWISFDYDWFEVRKFNPATGEFGDLIAATKL